MSQGSELLSGLFDGRGAGMGEVHAWAADTTGAHSCCGPVSVWLPYVWHLACRSCTCVRACMHGFAPHVCLRVAEAWDSFQQ